MSELDNFGKKRRNFIAASLGATASLLGPIRRSFSKEYPRPRAGVLVRPENANYEIFPENLPFKLDSKVVFVSLYWQTATLYNEEQKKMKRINSQKDFNFQVGTGKKGHETPIGVYNLFEKGGKNYKSHSYGLHGYILKRDKKGNLLPGEEQKGAGMPYAEKIERYEYNQAGELKLIREGIAIHGRNSSVTEETGTIPEISHGCLGVDDRVASELDMILKSGDKVVVFYKDLPKGRTLKDLVKELSVKKAVEKEESTEVTQPKKLPKDFNSLEEYLNYLRERIKKGL
jgi:hypothetical protein